MNIEVLVAVVVTMLVLALGYSKLLKPWAFSVARDTDLRILWPSMKRETEGDIDLARLGFITHMSRDPAWQELDFTEEELGDFVRRHLN